MANGDSISSDMNEARTIRVRKSIEDGDFAQCPVAGQKDAQLYFIDGMAAILKQTRAGNFYAMLSGGGSAGLIYVLIELIKAFTPHAQAAQTLTGN